MKTNVICLMGLCCLVVLIQQTEAVPRCQVHDVTEKLTCKYGEALDWCRNSVCAKGPDEQCGGNRIQHGKCGLGLMCHCGHCSGCSIQTRECSKRSMVC